MDVEDDIEEGSISSLMVNFLESNLNGDVQSNDDLAWVDSCLIKDSEILDNDWSTLKDALLEIVDSHPESVSYSASRIESSSVGTDVEILPSSEEAENAQSPGRNDDDVVSVNVKSKKIRDSYEINKKMIAQLLQDCPRDNYVMSHSVPIYNDSERWSEVFDSGLGSDLLAVEMEPPSEDIFKVWDLGVPAEEDELVKQLKTALVDTPLALAEAWNLNDGSIDHLIDGIADLSLS